MRSISSSILTSRQQHGPQRKKAVNRISKCFALAVLAAHLSAGAAATKIDEDTAAINRVLDRLEQAYSARDAQTLAESMHDRGVVVLDSSPQTTEAVVLGKKAIGQRLSDAFDRNAAPGSHLFTQRDISLRSGARQAFVTSVVKGRWAEGREQESTQLRVFVKEGQTWRVLLAMPLIFEERTLVTRVSPASQAAELGLRAGDMVTYYGGERIRRAGQLTQALQERAKQAPDTVIPLHALRGTETLRLKAHPGQLGCVLATRAFPLAGAEMIGPQTPHPVKETVARMVGATQRLSVDQTLREFFPGGGITFVDTLEGLLTAGPSNPREELEAIFKVAAKACDWSTYQCDQVRAIVQGPLAFVACRGRIARASGGEMLHFVHAYLYARRSGRWYWVAPLADGVDIGVDDLLGTDGKTGAAEVKPKAEETYSNKAFGNRPDPDGLLPDGSDYLPLSVGSIREYRLEISEQGRGKEKQVRSGAVVSRYVDMETINGKGYTKVLTFHLGLPEMPDAVSWLRCGTNGVYQIVAKKENPERLLFPLPPKVGHSWTMEETEGKSVGLVEAPEDVNLSECNYANCVRLKFERFDKQGRMLNRNTLWLAQGTGFVKVESEVASGGTKTKLWLTRVSSGE